MTVLYQKGSFCIGRSGGLSSVADNCPLSEGFILYRPLGLCYKYHWQLAFWDEAESVCQAAGTALLKVDNQDKFQHLYNFLRGSKGRILSLIHI